MDRPARILVIDGENIRATIKALLESDGYEDDLAANGSEAHPKKKETAVQQITTSTALNFSGAVVLPYTLSNNLLLLHWGKLTTLFLKFFFPLGSLLPSMQTV